MPIKGKYLSRPMRTIWRTFVFVLAVAIYAMAGRAEATLFVDVTYTGSYNGTAMMHTPEMGTTPEFLNFAIGPYGLEVKGAPAGYVLPAYYMCFDSEARIAPPYSWKAVVATAAEVATYYFGGDQTIAWEKTNLITYLASKWTPSSSPENKRDINKEMWEITADYSTLDLGSGSFYLQNANDIARINDLLASDRLHTGEICCATFLLPVVQSKGTSGDFLGNDGNFYNVDKTVQPFVAPVPEPGTLLLLGSGLVGLGVLARRRRK